MKRTYVKLLTVAGLTGCFLFTSCRSAQETTARYEISKVEGNMITIDSTWDANPDKKATTVLKPYKDKVDAMMYEVIGTSEMKMDKGTAPSVRAFPLRIRFTGNQLSREYVSTSKYSPTVRRVDV